jgi:hypothetical protein
MCLNPEFCKRLSYLIFVHRLTDSLYASSPRSVTLTQLRFTSLAVVSSRKDFHLQDHAHAGRTHPPLPKGRRFLPSRLCRDIGGFLLLTPYFRVHLAGDPGLPSPWFAVLNLGISMQELGFRFREDSVAEYIRSLHPRPEGRGFPRITG